MAVRIRMKRMGRTHRPFYRVCAVDSRRPRDGRVIEELGTYDPMVKETDARAQLKSDRIDYWLGVGAQPSDRVKVLIKKYGSSGTHLEAQKGAMERLQIKPTAPPPAPIVIPVKEVAKPAEEAAADSAGEASEASSGEASGDAASSGEASGETPASE